MSLFDNGRNIVNTIQGIHCGLTQAHYIAHRARYCVPSHAHSQPLAHVTQYPPISPVQAHSREWLAPWRERAIIAQGKQE